MKIRGPYLILGVMLVVAAVLLFFVFTGNDYDEFVAAHGHGHSHTAPHGGALFAFGDHFGHLELVMDPDSRVLWVYVLDGHAEESVRIPDEAIALSLLPGKGEKPLSVTLRATESPLRGESMGDSSVFKSEAPLPQAFETFEVLFSDFHFRGRKIEGLEGPFPDGNE